MDNVKRVEEWTSGPLRVIEECLETAPLAVVAELVARNERVLARLRRDVANPARCSEGYATREEREASGAVVEDELEAEFGELEW